MALDQFGNYTTLADAGYTRDQIVKWFNDLGARLGVSVEPSDVDQLISKLMGEAKYMTVHGGNPQAAFDIYAEQYRLRSGGQTASAPVYNTVTTQAPKPVIQPMRPPDAAPVQTTFANGTPFAGFTGGSGGGPNWLLIGVLVALAGGAYWFLIRKG